MCLLLAGEAGARRLNIQPAFKGFGGTGKGGKAVAPVDKYEYYSDYEYEYYDDDEVGLVGKVMIGGALAATVWGGEKLWRHREAVGRRGGREPRATGRCCDRRRCCCRAR